MASQIIESHRAGAEIFHGDVECKKKTYDLLVKVGIPKGMFPMEDIEEFAYNCADEFIWIIQKKKKKGHTFDKTMLHVSYAVEVTAFIESRMIKKMMGVKTMQLMLWLFLIEKYFVNPSLKELTFKTRIGLSDSLESSVLKLEG